MIRAYPREPSVLPGRTLALHVSTDSPAFRVALYRQGARLERMAEHGPFAGIAAADGLPDEDWGWPVYELPIPRDWPSGAYVALLGEVDAAGETSWPEESAAGDRARALVVVRSAAPGERTSILYKLSWATYHAYNATGYGSLYSEAVWSREHPNPGFKVTTRRPGGGVGGRVMAGDPPDAHEPASRRQTFAHWDAPFIAWLEAGGYVLDYCTDLDLHRDEGLLPPYRLLLSVGHDEYWSQRMRDAVDGFVKRGGNVAYFSGNISGYRIHVVDDDTALVCAKVPPESRARDSWERDEWQERDPENRVTGVSIYNAGGWWNGRRPPTGYTVQHAGHWAFDGTGLADGDVLGADCEPPLVGYECDGAELAWRPDGLVVATGGDGAPASFFVLGVASLSPGWFTLRPAAAATMGLFTSPRGGVVFQGATTDWPLVAPRDEHVGRVTRNVLDRLLLSSARVVGPLPARGGRAIAVEGEEASFHADVSGLRGQGSLRYRWTVSDVGETIAEAPVLAVAMPSPPRPVTVSLVVEDEAGPLAFGTRTLLPLSRAEALRLEICVLLHELAIPNEPSMPLASPTADPLSRIDDVIAVTLPWLRERAQRLLEATERLLELEPPSAP